MVFLAIVLHRKLKTPPTFLLVVCNGGGFSPCLGTGTFFFKSYLFLPFFFSHFFAKKIKRKNEALDFLSLKPVLNDFKCQIGVVVAAAADALSLAPDTPLIVVHLKTHCSSSN